MLLIVFWLVMGLLPDETPADRPAMEIVVAGLLVGGVLVLGGAGLALLATVLPVKFLSAAAQELANAAKEDMQIRDENLRHERQQPTSPARGR